ncbi:MAG TPA: hypothetical protein ENH97_02135 [bacterium]|nr:hypothetical protein [bacterium]
MKRSISHFLILTFLALLFLSPILSHIDYWGIHDWDPIASEVLATPRDSILKYGQWPLWNPYLGGGEPSLGSVVNFYLSPLFALILLFGPVVGIKLLAIVSMVIGLVGMFKLAREWGIKTTGAYLAALIFMFSSHFPLRIAQGAVEYYGQFWLPWILLFASRVVDRPEKWVKNSIWTAIFLGFAFLQGGSFHPILNLLILSLFFLIRLIQLRHMRSLLSLGLILILFFSLASIRLLPVMELSQSAWRVMAVEEGQAEGLAVLPAAFLGRDQMIRSPARTERLRSPSTWHWEDYGSYVGWLPVLLALLGLATWKRKRVLLGILLIFFILLYLGRLSPINLWSFFYRLPLFHWMRFPSRSSYIISLIIALSAGYGLTRLRDYFGARRRKIILGNTLTALLLIFVFFDLTMVSRPILRIAYIYPPQQVEESAYRKDPIYNSYHLIGSYDPLYMKYLQRSGKPGLDDPQTNADILPGQSAIAIGAPAYQGEWYLAKSGTRNYCRLKRFTPNAIWLEVSTVRSNTVVLNQNYFSGWRVKGFPGAKAIFYRGKIGIPVPPGQHQLKVYFWPRTFIWGLSLTLLAIGLSLWFLLRPFRPVYFIIVASVLFTISVSYLLFALQSPPQIQTIRQALDKEFTGDLEGAVADFKTALIHYPDSFLVSYQLALDSARLGRYKEASMFYQKALYLYPADRKIPYKIDHLARLPEYNEKVNSLAWLLATAPRPDLRDSAQALSLAKRVCENTGYNNPKFLDTLAAAYAKTGQFEKAIQTAQEAKQKALLSGQKPLAEKIKKRLKIYQAHRPYREPI